MISFVLFIKRFILHNFNDLKNVCIHYHSKKKKNRCMQFIETFFIAFLIEYCNSSLKL